MAKRERLSGSPGDPDATPAADVEGAELMSASFELLNTRPDGYDDLTGTADLARHDDGTTVTITFEGLVPDTDFIAHLHEGACADLGGPHFKFDPNGSDMPPNEIHLAFSSDVDGVGMMTAENHGIVGDNAKSVVVHPVLELDSKLACAEFNPDF